MSRLNRRLPKLLGCAAGFLVLALAAVGNAQVEMPAATASPTLSPTPTAQPSGPATDPPPSAEPTATPRDTDAGASHEPEPAESGAPTEAPATRHTGARPSGRPTRPSARPGPDSTAEPPTRNEAATAPNEQPNVAVREDSWPQAPRTPAAAPDPTKPSSSPTGRAGPGEIMPGVEPAFDVLLSPRTAPRDTVRLVEILRPLAEFGPTLEEVLVDGMGRFPVAGIAYYSDDWLAPRYTPRFHRHKGVDIFADFGTPIRAPDDGVITRFSNNPSGGGIAVWMRAESGDHYYFAHLRERADALRVGQRVDTGTVIGSVGDTGNARGGAPHLHFEVHRGTAIPPKPVVDAWLDDAEERAPEWVAQRREALGSRHGRPGSMPSAPLPTSGRSCARRTCSGPAASTRVAPPASPPAVDVPDAEVSPDAMSPASFDVAWRSPAQFLVTFGLLLVVAAMAWRLCAAWWASRRLRSALADPDPILRQSAVGVATAQGLARHAGALAHLVRHEQSPQVLHAVAEAVGRNLWEPGDNRGVIELRLWAEGRRRETAPVSVSNGSKPPTRHVPDDDLGRTRVLVTGAGGPAGVAVIRALAGRHHVVAVDADPLASGLRLAEANAIVPPASDPDFVPQLLDVVRRHEIRALISTLTEEMVVLSDHDEEITPHAAVWLASRSSLEACRDKWRFACVMREADIAVPRTELAAADGVPGPWVVKPRFDRGSRGVHHVDRAEDLAMTLRLVDDPIVQSRLRGREFTVDALVSRSGELVAAVPRWRLETKAGISTKGRTFTDDTVLEGVASVLSALHLHGAANVQGFVDDTGVTFVEVNPRFSGGLPLSLAAGADLVGEYLRGVLGLPIRCEHLMFRDGTTMTRHFEEIYA